MPKQLLNYIIDHKALFWSYPESGLAQLSKESVVETILNYGDLKSVKDLYQILNLEEVAEIFKRQSSQKRSNYLPQVRNFFNLYFAKHVPGYSK